MASYGWRQSRTVAEGLFEEGHLFSFLQSVRLLEEMYPDRTPPAEGVDPRREMVRFKSEVRLDYPPTDVERVRPPSNGGPVEMDVNVLGLAGVLGPLPPPVSELIVERSFRKDTALRDFLDIFNHRLVSMLYRARKKFRAALDRDAPHGGRIARVVYAIIGLGTPHLSQRLGVPDRSLLAYAGFLADSARSTIGLQRMLEDSFFATERRSLIPKRAEEGTPTVAITPFQGRWDQIEADDVTRIGFSGQNQVLGRTAVVGRRVWDQAARFEVRLGPLSFSEFLSFLPNGRAWASLRAMVRFYQREELGFTFRLELRAQEVPRLHIGAAMGAYLGWTTWLTTKPMTRNDAQVRLVGKR